MTDHIFTSPEPIKLGDVALKSGNGGNLSHFNAIQKLQNCFLC